MHQLDFGAVTHRGMVRALNEDSIHAEPPVFVVADGIGGAEAGEDASAMVVGAFRALAEQGELDSDGVVATLQRSHEQVRALQLRAPGAGSTVCGAVVLQYGEHYYWLIFNLGDSRAFRIYGAPGARRITQVSVDHSHVQELVEAGQLSASEADQHPERNVVTRAIGSPDGCNPDFWLIPMVTGDRFLFCTDGLLDAPREQARAVLVTEPDPAKATDDLLELALQSGARDNVSIIVVDVGSTEPDETTIPMAKAWR
ncbi:PP2C family protein-serine/threonine phosphatase [Enemella sp. A6]|uniref:PP2C family protein-serine/threonine phosphatase n=1 Tax=Enemella sp. A6 TaxID=3440152 RepID=UPI003EB7B78D